MAYHRLSPDADWSAALVDKFPVSWQARLMGQYQREHPGIDGDGEKRSMANMKLLTQVKKLTDAASAHIRPDAGDGEICQVAANTARGFFMRMRNIEASAARHSGAQRFGEDFVTRVKWFAARSMLVARGLWELAPTAKLLAARVARLCCERFWRRKLRTLHARTIEAVAIDLELVHKHRGLYVSDDAVSRRAGQLARNHHALENTIAINEFGQDFTIAQLAAKGTANKEIRRCELMTRIAGFELICKQEKHSAMMLTVTCPSRMHKMRTTKTGHVVPNQKYDGTTPKEAQQHLGKQWGRMRALAAKYGVRWYGFRIAEPQQDGTPHWHMLLFFPGQQQVEIECMARIFFHFDADPFEPGAHSHRVDFELIDWDKGSAASYISKYVSKNIDGYQVDKDLYGSDAITSSRRVDAWASSWGIRQFQQIGGPPVGVWRELRRLNPENVGEHAPDTLRSCVTAINLQKTEPGIASLAWRRFVHAQGGVWTKRAELRVKLYKEDNGEIGRYGERLGDKPCGVSCEGVNLYSPGGMAGAMGLMLGRASFESVESERCAWQVTTKGATAGVIEGLRRDAAMQAYRGAHASSVLRQGEAAQPWIHVNNCNAPGVKPTHTEQGEAIKDGYFDFEGRFVATCVHAGGAIRTHRKKMGRWAER
jgi:Bacteriophage replication gene A protein (GPA)